MDGFFDNCYVWFIRAASIQYGVNQWVVIGGETQCIAVLTSPAGLLVGERYLSRFPSSHDSPLTLGSTGGDKHTNGNHEYSSDRHKRHTRRAQNCHKLKLVSTGETCAIGGSIYNLANSVTCECWHICGASSTKCVDQSTFQCTGSLLNCMESSVQGVERSRPRSKLIHLDLSLLGQGCCHVTQVQRTCLAAWSTIHTAPRAAKQKDI